MSLSLAPMVNRSEQTFTCPHCGADVPMGAPACPECGSDEETGWSEDTIYDGLDLPEPGEGPRQSDVRKAIFWRAVAALVLIAIILLVIWGIW